jgi:mycofactocin precursor peptide peptidase
MPEGHTWTEVAATDGRLLLVVPVGSYEQHGPHLPLDTDTQVAVALASSLEARSDVLVAPAVAFGASGEHADFPGTLSIGTDALVELLVELVRSARPAFRGVAFVSGHGGNAEALERAAERSRREGDTVFWWAPHVSGGDAHAGRTETSLMLAINPGSVRVEAFAAGASAPLSSLAGILRRDGVRAASPNGVLGDPDGATSAEGRAMLATLQTDLAGCVDRWTGLIGAAAAPWAAAPR